MCNNENYVNNGNIRKSLELSQKRRLGNLRKAAIQVRKMSLVRIVQGGTLSNLAQKLNSLNFWVAFISTKNFF